MLVLVTSIGLQPHQSRADQRPRVPAVLHLSVDRDPGSGRDRAAEVPPVRPRHRDQEDGALRHGRRTPADRVRGSGGHRRWGVRQEPTRVDHRRRRDRGRVLAGASDRAPHRRPDRLRRPRDAVRGAHDPSAAGCRRPTRPTTWSVGRPSCSARPRRDERGRVAARRPRDPAGRRVADRRDRRHAARARRRRAADAARRLGGAGPRPRRTARCARGHDAGQRPDRPRPATVDPRPRRPGGPRAAERPADRGTACIAPTAGRRPGRGQAAARAQHPRRRAATARGARGQAPPGGHLGRARPARAREAIAALQDEANDALEDLRDLARGIYPPLLADRGLEAALAAQAQKGTTPATVEATASRATRGRSSRPCTSAPSRR